MHPTHRYRNTVDPMVFLIIHRLHTTMPCICVGRPMAILTWVWQLRLQDTVILPDTLCMVTPHLMPFTDIHLTIGSLIRPHGDPV